jgi:hypothetical protein
MKRSRSVFRRETLLGWGPDYSGKRPKSTPKRCAITDAVWLGRQGTQKERETLTRHHSSTDEIVTLPESVRRAAAEANALHQRLYTQSET